MSEIAEDSLFVARRRGRPRVNEPHAHVTFYVATKHQTRLAEIARQKDMSVSSLCAYIVTKVISHEKDGKTRVK